MPNLFEPTFDDSIFEIDKNKQMVNLTKIAKHFDKRLDAWKSLQSTKDFLEEMQKQVNTEILLSHKGNNGQEQGTWATQEVALEFAQWISPRFKVFCIKHLKQLFNTGSTSIKEFSRKEMLIQMLQNEEEKEALQLQIGELAPKAAFYDVAMSAEGAMLVRDAAKVLSKKGFSIGEHKLYVAMRLYGLLMSDNTPYQRYVDAKYFEVKLNGYTDKQGVVHQTKTTLVTNKGIDYLFNRLNDNIVIVDSEAADKIIENRTPICKAIHEESFDSWTAIDNSTGDAWTENFTTKKAAKNWLLKK